MNERLVWLESRIDAFIIKLKERLNEYLWLDDLNYNMETQNILNELIKARLIELNSETNIGDNVEKELLLLLLCKHARKDIDVIDTYPFVKARLYELELKRKYKKYRSMYYCLKHKLDRINYSLSSSSSSSSVSSSIGGSILSHS